MRIKKIITHQLLQQRVKRNAFKPNDAEKLASKVAILYAVTTKAELDNYHDELKIIEQANIPFDIIMFATEDMFRRVPVHLPYMKVIEEKDLNYFKYPRENILNDFRKCFYLGLINNNTSNNQALDFIAVTTPAKIKIGVGGETQNLKMYNMIVDNSNSNEPFILTALNYLKKIIK
ncbi:MAG: hypothetical protein NTX03_10485 [Bacteroidetes bacterium]|nr:hypothetical protein [Bacteroidota bacterium]